MKKTIFSFCFIIVYVNIVSAAGEYNVLSFPGIYDDGRLCSAAMDSLIAHLRDGTLPGKPTDLYFPVGSYRFSIDISGKQPLGSIWNCNGATFYPEIGKEYIIKCNNSGSSFGPIGLEIKNATFNAKYDYRDNDQTPPASYCIQLENCKNITLRSCTLKSAGVAALFGNYFQYGRFYDCSMSACVFSESSNGCLLTGPDADHRSNENEFFRCEFWSNSNGLNIQGAEKCRINDCTFQESYYKGAAALTLANDRSGAANRGCHVTGCWFELNKCRDIFIGMSEGLVIENCMFAGAQCEKVACSFDKSIESSHCYNIKLINNHFLMARAVKFSHPSNDTALASLEYYGNNLTPDITGITHAGPTTLKIDIPGLQFIQNENVISQPGLYSGAAFQHALKGNPLLKTEFAGFKQDILRTVDCNSPNKYILFDIIPENTDIQAYSWANLEITLSATCDLPDANIFGHSQRIDNYFCSINNYQDLLRASISQIYGKSQGLFLNYTGIGLIQLTTEKVTINNENRIRVWAYYCGEGTNKSATPSITIGYKVSAMGAGKIKFIRG